MSIRSLSRAQRNGAVAALFCCFAAAILCPVRSAAQEAESYLRGERKRLLIMVNVLGEVRNPGEYSVPDDTDLLGVIAKAGGCTEFGNLDGVRVTHRAAARGAAGNGDSPTGVATEAVDLARYLRGATAATPPVLRPGDVILVPRNGWSTWRTMAAVFRDVSVVASAVFLGIRAFDNTR